MAFDVGEIAGRITIEDELSAKLSEAGGYVKKFVDELEGSMGAAAGAVVVLTGAVVALTGSIVALGEKGSTILGVEDAFDRLAQSVGTTGDALSGALSEGVKHTVDDFELMQSTSRLLGSGMKLTTDNALLMGQAARELGKATGTDAAGGLSILSNALTTGRVRGLQQQIGLIDLKKGEEDFAKSLGVTVDQLNEEGKLEGKRAAILQATQAYVDRLGVSQLSFKERLQQGTVAVDEFFDSLSKSVASSPTVLGAVDSIGNAIKEAFGNDSKRLIEELTSAMNGFAAAIAAIVPLTIKLIGMMKDSIVEQFDDAVLHVRVMALTIITYAEKMLTALAAVSSILQRVGPAVSGLPGIGNIGQSVGAIGAGMAGPLASTMKTLEDLAKAIAGVTQGMGDIALATDKPGKSLDYLADKTKEMASATQASIAKTEELWDQYFSITAKMGGDTLQSQLDAIDRWSTQQKSALDKTQKLNQDYWNQLAALESVTLAKRLAATQAFTKALATAMQMVEVSVQPTAQGFENLNTALEHLGQKSTELDYVKDLATNLKLVEGSIPAVATGFYGVSESLENVGMHSTDIDNVRQAVVKADYATQKFSQTLAGQLINVLKSVPGTIANAFTGGGGLEGAFKSIGSQLGGTLGENLGNSVAKSMGAAVDSAGKAIGKLGSLAGPIGAAVGSLVGPLVDFFANIGGPSKEELAARDAFKAVQQKGESLSQTIQRLADGLMEAGKTGPEALQMIQRALDATHSSADGVNAAIDAINGTISDYKQDQADLNAAVQKYGFTIEELGPKMQKQQLDDQAKQLIRDWTLLVESGIQVATVNDRMASSIQDYLKNAKLTGQEVPEAMQPIIQKLIDQGDLTDDAGNKITDMKQLGISFSESMTAGFDKVVSRLDKLLEGLGLIPKALDEIDGKTVEFDIQGHYTPPDLPPGAETFQNPYGAAQGGYVTPSGISYYGGGGNVLPFTPRPMGTDTVAAMLTPGESVQSVSDVKSTSENLRILADEQATQSASLKNIERILKDNPRATGVAVADAVLLTPRRTA